MTKLSVNPARLASPLPALTYVLGGWFFFYLKSAGLLSTLKDGPWLSVSCKDLGNIYLGEDQERVRSL